MSSSWKCTRLRSLQEMSTADVIGVIRIRQERKRRREKKELEGMGKPSLQNLFNHGQDFVKEFQDETDHGQDHESGHDGHYHGAD